MKVVNLSQKILLLQELVIANSPASSSQIISKIDIKMRGINNSQEALRMIPGLFIGQHAGGGKAEQIFLRGFDLDHGTDINISVDGMPVNLVSHAHGQGYSDLHFVIPELIDRIHFRKGTYYPEKGNFTTTGYVDFRTIDALPANSIKLEGGMFHTFRCLGMVNLLSKEAAKKQQAAFIASEYIHTDGYFDHPQNFKRYNIFGKYNGRLNENNHLNFSLSTFSSDWNASGQIPDRAVASKLIGFFGAIDPDEGGRTARTNMNAQLTSFLPNGDAIKNQFFYSRYHFTLYSDFTFYNEDPVNGDQIRQKENRDLYGYNGSYTQTDFAGKTKIISEIGTNIRLDKIQNSELSRTVNRNKTIKPLKLGNISESNISAYISETFTMSAKFTINTGLRYDHFFAAYNDHLNNHHIDKAQAGIFSPKLNFYYQLNPNTQLYFTSGKGFHSNDTRVVVPQNGIDILPAAYGSDLGAVSKMGKNFFMNASIWYLYLQQEFVYVGDEGIV
ncbi:MAG: TonB-dependent receptor, partial [Flavisolibacter sp.]|nr:TonB-dependent receptor [Flavisolibacter sp.]